MKTSPVILSIFCMLSFWPCCECAYKPYFKVGISVDVYAWLSTDSDPYLGRGALFKSPPLLNFTVPFDWNMAVEPANISIDVPKSVRNNRTTLFCHLFLCKSGVHPNPWKAEDEGRSHHLHVISRSAPITRVMAEVKRPHKRNLIFDPPPPSESAAGPSQRILPHFIPRMQSFVVIDQEVYPDLSQEYLSPFVLFYLQHLNAVDFKKKTYLPMLHFDELSVLSKDLIPLNDSVTKLDFELKFQPLGLTRYEWMLKMEQSVQTHKQMGTPESEMEEVRRMFVETNSTLLVVTIVVSILHLLFDLLAFKNDISFWSSLESTKGISIRSVAVQTCMEVVVLLYLLDNETSYLVLITVVGTIIVNAWKLFKAWQLSLAAAKIKAASTSKVEEAAAKHKGDKASKEQATTAREGEEESKSEACSVQTDSRPAGDRSKEKGSGEEVGEGLSEEELSSRFDGIASQTWCERGGYGGQYLLLVLGPAIVGYAAYSLFYEKHKGWYSWALESGVNVVYAVGFMMMTPQLFLNYQYKSVDHLPWRALIYRALNTFIDDLFAFVITMPGLHRVAVFRDDVVFFIYLYQRWIYRTRRPPPGVSAEKEAEQADREALVKSSRSGKSDPKSRGGKKRA